MENVSKAKDVIKDKKIAIVSEYRNFGGAAIASYRLYLSLKSQGFKVDFIHRETFRGSHRLISECIVVLNKLYERIIRLFIRRYNVDDFSFAIIPNFVLKRRLRGYDIIDLHWIRHFTNPEIVNDINGKVYITTHDMRHLSCFHYLPIYKNEDLRYIDSFGVLDDVNSCFRYKYNSKVIFRPPSTWLCEAAKFYYPDNEIQKSPYAVSSLSNVDRLNSLTSGSNVLCGAMSISEFRKGGWLLMELIELRKDLTFHVFGNSDLEGFNVINHGYLDQKKVKELFYRCQLLIFPSIQENFSNILIESNFFQVPIVCFNVGGNKDLVKHKKNGYLLSEISVESLNEGADYCLEEKNLDNLRKGCLSMSNRLKEITLYC